MTLHIKFDAINNTVVKRNILTGSLFVKPLHLSGFSFRCRNKGILYNLIKR